MHETFEPDELPEDERRLLAAAARDVMENRRMHTLALHPDELAAFADGTLPAAERARLEDAIAADPEAAAAVRDLRAFPAVEPRPGTPRLSAGELESGWQELRSRLAAEGVLEPRREALRSRRLLWGWTPPARLAAAFAAVAVTLGTYLGWLHGSGRIGDPGQGGFSPNPTILGLLPVGSAGERGVEVPRQPEGERTVLVLALLGEFAAGTEFRLEVYDPAERLRATFGGLRRQPTGEVNVDLFGGTLPEGLLSLRLVVVGDGRPAATYRLQVDRAPP